MKGKIPKLLARIVVELLKTVCTWAVGWALCAAGIASLLLRAVAPLLVEAVSRTIVAFPMVIKIP